MSKERIAFKTRVYLNNKQSRWMKQNCIAARLAYNYAIECLRNSDKEDEFPNPPTVRKRWSAERDTRHPWMKERRLVQAGINDAINARYKAALNNWKTSGYSKDKAPTFQGKGRRLSITWTYIVLANRHVRGRMVTLPQKQGTVRLAEPIPHDGPIKQTTFSHDGTHWHVSFLIEAPARRRDPAPEGTAVGVDLGVAQFASLSNGTHYPSMPRYKAEVDKLERLQKQLSRMEGPIKKKRKASRNWLKQKSRVSKQYRRLANLRRDYIEHISRDLARDYHLVAVEDLNVKNMTASAKGDTENPGSNVKAKSGLNRSILANAFHLARTRIEAKVASASGEVVAVNPRNTSRTCPSCGHVAAENRLTQSNFKCVECGYSDNADIVAAQNILHRALA